MRVSEKSLKSLRVLEYFNYKNIFVKSKDFIENILPRGLREKFEVFESFRIF